MNFSEAATQLTSGNKIRRKSWPQKNYLVVVDGEVKRFAGFVREYFFDNSIIISSDWLIGDDTENRHPFSMVVDELIKGNTASLPHWKDKYIKLNRETRNIDLFSIDETESELIADDMLAIDWEIIQP